MTANRFFELRTYHATPGKLDALEARFTDHTLGLFAKHGMTLVGFWRARGEDGEPNDDLVYLLAYPDAEARERSWKSFQADPDWVKAKDDSQVDGPLTTSQESLFLDPTSYSPIV